MSAGLGGWMEGRIWFLVSWAMCTPQTPPTSDEVWFGPWSQGPLTEWFRLSIQQCSTQTPSGSFQLQINSVNEVVLLLMLMLMLLLTGKW